MRIAAVWAGVAVTVMPLASTVHAQTVAEFYRGKSIGLEISSSVGSVSGFRGISDELARRLGVRKRFEIADSQQGRVVGYHALTAAAIEREAATARVTKRMPQYPIPVVLLARLVVDLSAARRGPGVRAEAGDAAHRRDACRRLNAGRYWRSRRPSRAPSCI